MKSDYLLSICIPTYNPDNGLVDRVNKILNCGIDEVEIVINDNCSNNDTISKLKQIKNDNLNIYVNEKNQGAYLNWRYALDKGKGEWLILLNDNDEIVCDNLPIYLKMLKSSTALAMLNGDCGYWNFSGYITGEQFIYCSQILSHPSYAAYRKSCFKRLQSNTLFSTYSITNWNMEAVLSIKEPSHKIYYINNKIPIIKLGDNKIISRTQLENKSGIESFSLMFYINEFEKAMMGFSKYSCSKQVFSKYALFTFFAIQSLVIFRYYTNMNDECSAKKYMITQYDYTEKNWIDIGDKFYQEALQRWGSYYSIDLLYRIAMFIIKKYNNYLFSYKVMNNKTVYNTICIYIYKVAIYLILAIL